MGWVIYVALIAFAIISSNKKKKEQAAKKAAAEKRRREQATVFTEAPEAGFPNDAPETPEGECAPDHRHTAETEKRHVLKPSFETGHAHTESSMSQTAGSGEFCPTEDKKGFVPQGEHSSSRDDETLLAERLAAYKAAKAEKQLKEKLAAEAAPQPAAAEPASVPAVGLSTEKIREAIVLSEILAKPKALRR